MWNEKTNMPYYKGEILYKLEGLTMFWKFRGLLELIFCTMRKLLSGK